MSKVLVILDTCFIRNIIHEKKICFLFYNKESYIKILNELIKLKDKADFRIGETAFAELIRQLLEKRIKFKEWEKRIKLFDDLLDNNLPIQYFGVDLSVDMQIKKNQIHSKGFSIAYWKSVWSNVRISKYKDDLKKEIKYEDNVGNIYRTKIYEDIVKRVFEEELSNWICYFRNIKSEIEEYNVKNNQRISKQNEIIKLIEDDLINDGYDLNKVKDFNHVISKYVELYLKNQYRPESAKRDGDVFDFSFLHILSKPAIICTTDKKFQRFVRESKAPNSDNIMLPIELLKYLKI